MILDFEQLSLCPWYGNHEGLYQLRSGFNFFTHTCPVLHPSACQTQQEPTSLIVIHVSLKHDSSDKTDEAMKINDQQLFFIHQELLQG